MIEWIKDLENHISNEGDIYDVLRWRADLTDYIAENQTELILLADDLQTAWDDLEIKVKEFYQALDRIYHNNV